MVAVYYELATEKLAKKHRLRQQLSVKTIARNRSDIVTLT